MPVNKIGIMQGRLSPRIGNRLQAFPWSSWQAEFKAARRCELDLIEWLFDGERYQENPLWTDAGIREIQKSISDSQVQVQTCCANYFMGHPFFRVAEDERAQSISVLNRLIERSAELGVKTILIPVLESCEIRTLAERSLLIKSLQQPITRAAQNGIRLAIETELPAHEYRELIEQIDHPNVGIYYDTGNNTAAGHDIVADTEFLASYFAGVHIKDRKRGGPNVSLGQGDANFIGFFTVLKKTQYESPLILETTFGEDPLESAKAHRDFVYNQIQ